MQKLLHDTCIFCTLRSGEDFLKITYQTIVQVDVIKEDRVFIVKSECLECYKYHIGVYGEDEFNSKLVSVS